MSHSCEGTLHTECLGVERYWDQRFCSCRHHVTAMQSMPDEWQARFVGCLQELDDAIAGFDYEVAWYSVQARGSDNRFIRDPVPHYNRGRTRVELNPSAEPA